MATGRIKPPPMKKKKRWLKVDRAPREVKQYIAREYYSGKNLPEIQEALLKKYKYNVGVHAISTWIQTRTDAMESFVLGDDKFLVRLQKDCVDIISTFKTLTARTWKLLDELEEVGEIENRLKVFKEIREQLEMANKMMGVIPKAENTREGQNIDLRNIGVKIAERVDAIRDGSEKGVIEISQDTKRISIKEEEEFDEEKVIDL